MTAPDTIFALGTGPGRAAIAVIRISGPGAGNALKALAGKLPAPRQASFAILRDPETGEMLDRGIALFYPGPASSTGEDYAELQLHGGRAVVEGALAALHRLPGLRPAEPGEFARRSFANGKLDLSQAEALADLVDAQTEAQRRQALRVAGGALRRKVEGWRAALVESLAFVEAELDFSDEADVGVFSPARLGALLSPLAVDLRAALQLAPASERMREGFLVMILGRPNVGKSTLINALTRRDLAIVSPIPGTTRDMIEAHLDIGGLPVTLIDTAGLREAADAIERIGVDRTLARVETADLALWLSDSAEAPPHDEIEMIRVATKTDLTPAPQGAIGVCALSGEGLEALAVAIEARARARMGDGAASLIVRERHRHALEQAVESIDSILAGGGALELQAEELRRASQALGRIVGAVDVEEILDAVFSRFCIGK
ncbi:tRNA uridine-5-carboxymethylaminomethyl(34) synthesis GTPase MnmE [Methylocystis sp. H62]|uniref:tRNA uridine-5-carboxymethylaminomethyl(34) synthesis GTPase MnmE n=1 Tax=Methylocystis sp. H62 TaxID=2785789 RepID=UPI0018C20600|nr:tRNA uridine-5-carboxymethylaminomethyl(34) synthesis GTPase MnmE [Methylocystis sp. H62]MBG0794942.1 tRNA uridine-5-carboxymethylaminomethyl(34) synthesis GTPase MnmE [Methylocystis sp. H62]